VIGIEEFIGATSGHGLLEGFEPRDLERLAALAKEVHFNRNYIIFHEGEQHGFFYLIIDGSVALEMIAAGHAVTLQTLHPGDAMAWSSLVSSPRGAHFEARVLTPVRALAFEGAALREACESDPPFGFRMMKALLTLITERLDASRMQVLDMYADRGAVRS